MYRLGDHLLVRLPRTPDNAKAVRKERTWLPRLAPHLPCRIPEPVHEGVPGPAFPLAWSVYRWIDGDEAGPASVTDRAAFGSDLATVVRSLRSVPLMGATRQGGLSWYRGGGLRACDRWISGCFDACRTVQGLVHGQRRLLRLLDLRRMGCARLLDRTGQGVRLHGHRPPGRSGRLQPGLLLLRRPAGPVAR
ncbi:phosphotransferase [Streptomyces nitrosporeus]|uniref:phosphotransferase n=1 Tax=Streptomyces nitrosporeus TaxID=28894 RepID=UPI0039A3355E